MNRAKKTSFFTDFQHGNSATKKIGFVKLIYYYFIIIIIFF